MPDQFINAKFIGDISLTYYRNEFMRIDELVVQQQLKHHAEWLNQCAHLNIRYIGPSANPNLEQNKIKVMFVPRSQMPSDWAWAWAYRDVQSIQINASILRFSEDEINTPARFAGIFPHENWHAIGGNHWNADISIMNNDPSYLHHTEQGLYRVEDMWGLTTRLPGSNMKGHPILYDYGNPEGDQAKIFIPALNTSHGFKSVMFDVSVTSQGWRLVTDMTKIRPEYKRLDPVCYFDANDVLQIPILHMGAKLRIQAKLISKLPSHTVEFEILSIGPDNE